MIYGTVQEIKMSKYFMPQKKAMQQKISALKSTLLKIACFPTANERENSLASVTDR